MLYRLTARTDCKITLSGPATIEDGGIRIDFVADDDNSLRSIAATRQLDEREFYSSYAKGKATDRAIKFQVDPLVLEETQEVLRGIESHLSFASSGGLVRFDWESLRHELVPETEDERERAQVLAITITEGFDREPVRMGKRDLQYIVKACSTHQASVLPKSFWREAHNEYLSLRFIQAFYNFYFVIEGYFGGGKSGEKTVLAEFAKSKELQQHVAWMVDQASKDSFHWPKLLELCSEENCSPDVPGIQRLLVRLRGRLHHFSMKSSKAGPLPSNQRLFFSVAWLAQGIATRIILGRDVAIGPMPHVLA